MEDYSRTPNRRSDVGKKLSPCSIQAIGAVGRTRPRERWCCAIREQKSLRSTPALPIPPHFPSPCHTTNNACPPISPNTTLFCTISLLHPPPLAPLYPFPTHPITRSFPTPPPLFHLPHLLRFFHHSPPLPTPQPSLTELTFREVGRCARLWPGKTARPRTTRARGLEKKAAGGVLWPGRRDVTTGRFIAGAVIGESVSVRAGGFDEN